MILFCDLSPGTPACLTLYIYTVEPENCLQLFQGSVQILDPWAFLHLGQSLWGGAESHRTLRAYLLR